MIYGMMNNKFVIFLCFACMVFGFIIGRKTIETKEVVRYIKDDPVSGSVADLIPVKETIPDVPELPLLHDTVYLDSIVYVTLRVDTAAIINDYIAQREYTPVLLDSPQLGKLSLSATVQYNKLSDLTYEFSPIVKEITRYKVVTWQPYIGTSYNTFNQISFVAGTFYKKSAVELQYISDIERRKHGYGIGYKYKF